MKKIVLTGGGTAGHVTPNIALIPKLEEKNYEIHYIGSKNGIEKSLIAGENIPYYEVSTGKMRRQINFENIKKNTADVFNVAGGLGDAIKLLSKIKPDIVFSKGGFVAVPVIIAAKIKNIPVVCHESDITPGLANKIAAPFAKKICTSFPETLKYIKKGKGVVTGSPIRKELFSGSREKGLKFTGLNGEKPIVLVMGGSLGSVKINNALRSALDEITESFDIIHLCGKGNKDEGINNSHYKQFEYISKELKDIFAAADIVCARAGSNSVFEYLALKKPMLLIPLSARVSRGDQILNAKSFKEKGFAEVLNEDTELSGKNIALKLNEIYKNRDKYIEKMKNTDLSDGVIKITDVIESCIKTK